MAKQEAPIDYLKKFIPGTAAEKILGYLNLYRVHLTITRERKSILGDYRHATTYANHRISINGNLNQYSFLITLIHEIAHLVTFEKYGNKVMSHGKEWKALYALLLQDFLSAEVFPADILHTLKNSLHDLPASSCSDENLMRVLKRYDVNSDGTVMVEQIEEGKLFEVDKGGVFRRGKKLRKRYQCVELKTGKLYLFSPIYEVKKL